jgi:NADH-quinone oxidoreductase subunit G
MPTLIIDGIAVEVAPGTTILEAAQTIGIEIPHFCYHPHLSVAGNCRMCLVEIEKNPKLVISCATPAADGMVVSTRSPKVLKARVGMMEFLLLNHPLDCPICDQVGECYLQEYYMQHALHHSRMKGPKDRKRKVVDLGDIVLDAERCVLCSRCVRFTHEVMGTGELAIHKRGNRSEIATFNGAVIRHGYAGNLAEICPVGALTSRDFRFKKRVYKLKRVPSVCDGCSTGCNIFIESADNTVYRFRARRNDAVNRSWLCDHGRFGYPRLNRPDRIVTPLQRVGSKLEPLSFEQAVADIAEKLARYSDAIAGLGSAAATNETNWMLLRMLSAFSGTPEIDFRLDQHYTRRGELSDGLLRRSDPYPNSQGCIDLKMMTAPNFEAFLERLENRRFQAIYILNAQLLVQSPHVTRLAAGLGQPEWVIMHATEKCQVLELAHFVLPGLTFAEQTGTFTNHAGMVQPIHRAIEPPGKMPEEWAIMGAIWKTVEAKAPDTLPAISAEMAADKQRFSKFQPFEPTFPATTDPVETKTTD